MSENRRVAAGAAAGSRFGLQPRSKGGVIGEIISIAHPRAVVIFSALVLVAASIAERGAPPLRTTAALVVAMALVQIAVGVLNDYCDRDLDAVAKPRRALPAGFVRPRWALLSGSLTLALGLTTAATLGADSLLVLALGAGMGVLYSVAFKRSFLSWLPYAVAYPIVPVWVWVSLGKFTAELLVILPVSMPLSIGVHLCNQLRDYDDDASSGMKGLAQYLGKAAASTTCLGLLLFGPLFGLVFRRRAGIGGLLLLSATTLVHWMLVSRCLVWNRNRADLELWRDLFRSLQLSGPLLLSAWLLAAAP